MADMAGGSGVGSNAGGIQLIKEAQVKLPNGSQVDLSTAEGVQSAESQLDAEQLAELEVLMRDMGFERSGEAFVPRDEYDIRRERGISGPTSTTAGMDDLDREIGEKVFVKNGVPNPFNAAIMEKLEVDLGKSKGYEAAVASLTEHLANPTNANAEEFLARMKALSGEFPDGNVMELLFLVFRESIKATNEDKKYFLLKLQEFNTMAEKISDYLTELVEKSQELSEKCDGEKYPEKVHLNVECKTFDLAALKNNGELAVLEADNRRLDRAGLNDTIKIVESMQETVRNKRQMASTAFQNFDQKSNQLYNLMAAVMKSLNEMRGGTVRNML